VAEANRFTAFSVKTITVPSPPLWFCQSGLHCGAARLHRHHGAGALERRHDAANMGFKAVLVATLANLTSATLAGIFVSLA
jgi:hypothetical protein